MTNPPKPPTSPKMSAVIYNPLRLPPLPTIRDLLRLYRLRALKQLSQNFLLDKRITDKIVKAAGDIRGHTVCEVGPGPGSITRSIMWRNPAKVIVVEKDSRFLPALELLKEAAKGRVELDICIDDIRSYNFECGLEGMERKEWTDEPPPLNLIGNLPFNVSTNLMIRWLHSISQKSSAWSFGRTPMTLTFQKEVAERMVAKPMENQRCRLSVMCQMWCDVQHKFTIPGKAFLPKPDVDVGVVHLNPKSEPVTKVPFKIVEKVLRTIFNMRQKSSIKSAGRLFPPEIRTEYGK